MNSKYIGDGVYVRTRDGYSVVVTVNRHDNYTSDIVLDKQVLENLIRYAIEHGIINEVQQ